MMAVGYDAEPTFRPSTAVALFGGPYPCGAHSFDVSPDGRRFLMVKDNAGPSGRTDLIVVQNWVEELKRLVPTQ